MQGASRRVYAGPGARKLEKARMRGGGAGGFRGSRVSKGGSSVRGGERGRLNLPSVQHATQGLADYGPYYSRFKRSMSFGLTRNVDRNS